MCIMVLICVAHFNQHHLNKVGWLTPIFNWTQVCVLWINGTSESLPLGNFLFFIFFFYKIYKNNK